MAFKVKPWKIHNLPNFRYGLNTMQTPDEILDEELADCENFSVEEDSVSTAPGYSTWDDDIANHPGPYYGFFMFAKSDGTMVDIRQRQGKLEYSPDGDPTWSECTLPTDGSPAATVTLSEIPCSFAALNDTCLWSNGTDTVMSSSDGITWTLRPSLPISGKLLENAKNRILFLNQADNPYRIDWSNINDPLTIGANSFQLVDPNNNGKVVTGALTPEGTTLIFKEGGLYSISDYVDDGIIDMNYIGATTIMSINAAVTTEDSVIWLGYDGFLEFIGGQIRLISSKISWIGRNQVYGQEKMCGAYYNSKVHFAMPDLDITNDYNSQEYIIYKKLYRNDPAQPYVITRNRRYIGCYGREDFEFDYGFDSTLYICDSRPAEALVTSGSPAVTENPVFAWVNDYRLLSDPNFEVQAGLGGYSQPAFFITKYFTENMPYFVKKYKKIFANLKFTNTASVTISYRFDPYGAWTSVSMAMETTDIDMIYDDGNTGGFSEGYGFSQDSIANLFFDIENAEKPRGIQFKVEVNEIYDVTNFSMAYKFSQKDKFK